MPEVTYLLESGGNKAYFGGDTMLAPEVRTIAQAGPVDVAFLPINGLNVGGKPAVMSSEEAAVMAGMLRAAVAIPIHYRFTGGPKTEGTVLTYNGTTDRFVPQRGRGCAYDKGGRTRTWPSPRHPSRALEQMR